ncbi:hypothetical protein AAFN88_11845 [Pelagibius sp. CAU 1746]|uniref:hypothetical protein n=1 Tax=Pelagibius sp. CAU 1746 TaxID=3140370 RepID=UPI00325B9B02
MAEGLLARLYALRALAVFAGAALVLVSLASGAWAEEARAGDGAVQPAGVAGSSGLKLSQEKISREIDGWLNVIVDEEGRVTRVLSEGLVWRLEISSLRRLDPQSYIFSVRPAGMAAADQPCGPGEICPAGYSVAGSSRSVVLEPLREMKGAAGQTVYRQTAKVALPFGLSWVEFYDDFQIAVAAACRDALLAERGRGRSLAGLRDGYLDPELTFPLKAAVFTDGRIAETDLAVHLRCWGKGLTR